MRDKNTENLIYGIESTPRFYNSSITFFCFEFPSKRFPAGDFHEFSAFNDRCCIIPHWGLLTQDILLFFRLQSLIQLISKDGQLRKCEWIHDNKLTLTHHLSLQKESIAKKIDRKVRKNSIKGWSHDWFIFNSFFIAVLSNLITHDVVFVAKML